MAGPGPSTCDKRPNVAARELTRHDHVSIIFICPTDERPLLTHAIVVSRRPTGLILRSADSQDARDAWGLAWDDIVACRKGHASRAAIVGQLLPGREVLLPGNGATEARCGAVRVRRGRVVAVRDHLVAVADQATGGTEWHDVRMPRVYIDAEADIAPPGATTSFVLRRRVPANWTIADVMRRRRRPVV